ncbi:MAG: hypothetical protein B7X35_06030 [Halothiobacillus sp. 14-56-357]|jgi:hypothetical protein|nr:MAG: hypothetical protein B7X44_05095 [Halothiobacillus sp. 15-55-196]OZB56317.1 MAG: hypothetical protein B7X35_06030 [Halothiobacillus sp. 14-56-357]OZB78103.1 MAG: hypothetical protein B7X29_06145 [Halothiobacillus sp. 13-55-115]
MFFRQPLALNLRHKEREPLAAPCLSGWPEGFSIRNAFRCGRHLEKTTESHRTSFWLEIRAALEL